MTFLLLMCRISWAYVLRKYAHFSLYVTCLPPSDHTYTWISQLSAFGTPLRGGRLGTECLWDMARKCNRQVAAAVQACLEEENTDVVNFIQTDFPNYPGHGGLSLVELAHQLNLRRSSWRRRFRRLLHRRGWILSPFPFSWGRQKNHGYRWLGLGALGRAQNCTKDHMMETDICVGGSACLLFVGSEWTNFKPKLPLWMTVEVTQCVSSL